MPSGDDDSTIDWAKAAADWAKGRKDGQPASTLPPPRRSTLLQMPPAFLPHGILPHQPFPMHGFPPFGLPPMLTPHGLNGYQQGYFSPPAFIPPPTAPYTPSEAEMKARAGSQLPRWLADAVKNKEGSETRTNSETERRSTEDEEMGASGFLLTPPSSPKDSDAKDATEMKQQLDETSGTVKKRMTEILLNVTEDLIRTIATETLNQSEKERRLTLSAPPIRTTQPTISQPPMPIILTPGAAPPLSGLHLTLSAQPTASGPGTNVIPGEELEVMIDEREDDDNGGHPFINPEEPTKGLFRAPPDCVELPNVSNEDEDVARSEGLVVKCVCYSKNGKPYWTKLLAISCGRVEKLGGYVLTHNSPWEANFLAATVFNYDVSDVPRDGTNCYLLPYGKKKSSTTNSPFWVLDETYLNGRTHLVIGSSPRQAHIIDSHTSVYSQHVAISICRKTTACKPVQPCSLYLFPCGGSAKLVKPEDVSFLQPPPEEVEEQQEPLEDEEKKETVAKKNALESVEILNDGDRKREIRPGTQIYLQVGSSNRYYLIDCSQWERSFLISSTSEFITADKANALEERQKSRSPSSSHRSKRPRSQVESPKRSRSSSRHRRRSSRRRSRHRSSHRRDPSRSTSLSSDSSDHSYRRSSRRHGRDRSNDKRRRRH